MFRWGSAIREGSTVPVSSRRCFRAEFIVRRCFVASAAEKDEEANGYGSQSADESANCDTGFGARGEGGADGRGGESIGEGEHFGADDADGGICGVGGGRGGDEREGRGTVAWSLAGEGGSVD